jgi:hypothetical protein
MASREHETVNPEPNPTAPAERASLAARLVGAVHRIHKGWMIAAFVAAAGNLFLLRHLDPRILLLFLLPPGIALLITGSRGRSPTARVLATAFLVCLAAGIVLSHFPTALPGMRSYPELPVTEDRLLTWYTLVYTFFIMVIVPPVGLASQLLRRRRGVPNSFSPITSWAGLALWLLGAPFLVRFLITVMIAKWLAPH